MATTLKITPKQKSILGALLEGPKTRFEVSIAIQGDVQPGTIGALATDGLIVSKDVLRKKERGRPAHIYRLTDKGRKRAKRAKK